MKNTNKKTHHLKLLNKSQTLGRPSTIIDIAIAELVPLTMTGIKTMLGDQRGIQLKIEANNSTDLWTRLTNCKPAPHVCVIDMNIGSANGYTEIELLKRKFPEMKILVFTDLVSPVAIMEIEKAGADGYLHKHAEGSSLISAIKDVHYNGFHFPRYVMDRLHAHGKKQSLTKREKDFLALCGKDKICKEIADEMKVTHSTVAGYEKSICQKFGLRMRAGLVTFAIQTGFYTIKTTP